MRAVESVEANLQNIYGVAIVKKQYKKYVNCAAEKHSNNSILYVYL